MFLLACAAILVEGYHLGVDDGAIYLPAINKVFDPRLYPFGAEFFLRHGRLSLFGSVVGRSARWLHLPVASAVLIWHVGCLVLLLVGAWQVACVFFSNTRARWGAVVLLAGLLPVPVAGTALFLADNYVSARSFSTPLTLLAVGFLLRGRMLWALLCVLLTALFHPQMAVYCAALLTMLWWTGRGSQSGLRGEGVTRLFAKRAHTAASLAALVPLRLLRGFSFQPAEGAYRDVLYSRTYFFASLWHWYEWIGVAVPLLLLALLGSSRSASAAVAKTSRSLVWLGALATLAFLAISSSRHLESFARLQPMRAFHLIYVLLILMLGGVLGEHILRGRPLRWIALLLPLVAGMYALDRSQYPSSAHIEWPWRATSNPWLQAFAWVRVNTPIEAVFALDPNYLALPGEDRHGFRALAERSALADFVKDSGVVTMFPDLLPEWKTQQQMERGWPNFDPADFDRLARISPVTWVIVSYSQQKGLSCPYRNRQVAVCRIGSR